MKNYILTLFSAAFFFSCDPGVEETMVIHNKSGKELTVFLQNKYLPAHDSASYIRLNEGVNIRFIQYNDSVIQLEAGIPHGTRFYLHEYNGIGYINYEDSKTASDFLQSFNDTLYLKSHTLARDIYNFDNWHQDVEKETWQSSARFTFSVSRGDIR